MILFFLFHPYHYRSQQLAQQLAASKIQVNVFLHLFFLLRFSASPKQIILIDEICAKYFNNLNWITSRLGKNILFKYIVAINEFYYQLELMSLFL
jgi:hypothetical protein